MKSLLSVHGISTDGPWQDQIEDVFKPHFRYYKIRYRHYRRLGPLKLILEPWVLFPLMFGIWLLWHLGIVTGIRLWLTCAAFILLTYIATYLRRRLALNAVKTQITPHMLRGERPHIIAHSFGTYLIGTSLKKFPEVRAADLIFSGCVLTRTWNWKALHFPKNRFAFTRVRNEVAERDWIVFLAYMLNELIWGFGMAGLSGFREEPHFIHSVPSPHVPCDQCKRRLWKVPAAPVHNVFCREIGHNDANIGPGFAASFWLPYLWGIDPPEYQWFMELVDAAIDLEEVGNYSELRMVEWALRNTKWSWTKGALSDYVERQVRAHPRFRNRELPVDEIVDQSIAVVWTAIKKAKLVSDSRVPGWELQARALNPKIAVTSAVNGLSFSYGADS
ncbi:MAG: hypothetical protein HY651_13165 [Acidobacteria bacterium]|nr:hypothetical protein [Acidobacteriota bacterium]